MEVEGERRYHRVNSFLVAVTLTVIAIGLVVQIVLATQAAASVEAEARKHFLRLAWAALVLLAFDAVVLFWLGIRYLADRSRQLRVPRTLPYVDAWAAAGERFQVDDEEPEDDDEDTEEQVDRPDSDK